MTAHRCPPHLSLLVTVIVSLTVAACAEEPTPSVIPPDPGDGPAADLLIVDSPLGENRYEPDELRAAAGMEVTVQFRNGSRVEHTLTFDEPIDADTGVVAAGAMADVTFPLAEPGEYGFHCEIHPGMEGVLVAR